MSEPRADRPYMPGYGVLPPAEGGGVLPWEWATERLDRSREYWVSSVRPDGRPHASPVWGVWHDGLVWFSCSGESRKAKNLDRDPRCVVTTNDAVQPVIVEGSAGRIRDRSPIERYTELTNDKYGVSYEIDFYLANAVFAVSPATVFGLDDENFTGSPTRWHFCG
ncbi:MAG: pyridoxamine 5'-phosphate oxidase family protein [Acidimicrobiia bacterium]